MDDLQRTSPAGQQGDTFQSGQGKYTTNAGQNLTYTVWLNNSGTKKSQKTQAWPEFCQWLQDLPAAKVKDDCKLIKLATFGDERTGKACLRHNANVLAVTGIEGDYDSEIMTPEQAIEMLEGYNLKAVIAPTFSATPDNPRWRVLTPLSEQITPDERLRYIEVLNGMLGGDLASESATLSQSFYIGVPAGAPYTVLHTFDDSEEGYTLDELDKMESIDQHRRPLQTKRQKQNGDSGNVAVMFDDTDFEDWVSDVCSGEEVHPAVVRIAGHCVAKGWDDQEIKTLFIGLAHRVEAERGAERGALLRGKELDDAIASARAKGYAPREYAELLAEAQKLTKESDPDAVDALLQETIPLSPTKKRQVWQAIKKATGIPFSVMKQTESACSEDDGGNDDLQLARALVDEIDHNNVIGADTFVWQWRNTGVWQKQEDRSVRQWV
jgi:hypothetical protein